jgi:O-acetylhomoserine/O-acetylserine sulfhydrylase-like pyridoxal-dependent enzyme
METPSNPGLKLVDIEKVAEIVRRRKDVLLAIDNTFLSPYFQVGFIEQRSKTPHRRVSFIRYPL